MIGLTLKCQAHIYAFKAKRWLAHPWMRDVAGATRTELQSNESPDAFSRRNL